jgi:CDP-4-dehydro-6-deoxyglucose reductase
MSYEIIFEPSGQKISAEAGENVLAAALRQGLMIPYSCRGGTCGSCMGKVLHGQIDYPHGLPPAITAAEAGAGGVLLCQARTQSDLRLQVREIRQAGDIVPRRLPARVVKIEQLAHDVRRLYLRTPGNERLQFLAGQYLEILLPGGKRRGFSLANAPHDDELLELHIRRVPGGQFTAQVFETMKEGALLRLEAPLGQFYLREDSPRPILLMAGGTGFAPIKGMLEHAFHLGIDRPMHFYWGVRSKRDLYLDALPRQWAEQHANFHYTPVLSEPLPEDAWDGRIGLVHNMLLVDHPQLQGYDLYMSGPPGMIAAARRDFAAHGLDPQHLHFDSFEFAGDSQPSAGPATS